MEKLGNEVVETVVEVTTNPTCPIKRALPVAAIVAVGAGVLFLGSKVRKIVKAKKAAKLQETSDEVNPEQSN